MGYRVLFKRKIGDVIIELDVLASNISSNAKAGQFVMVRLDEFSERIPLTIADTCKEKGSIKLFIQDLGVSSKKLSFLNVGDEILDVLGPLGEPFKSKYYGNVIVIGGGVGIAAIAPIIKELNYKKNEVFTIIGVRNASLFFLEENLKKYSRELFLSSNDGSLGEKGFTTDILARLLKEKKDFNLVVAVGPLVMMKAIYDILKKENENREREIPLLVSLEVLMVDGIGMCGACKIKYKGEYKFTCTDGPIFDAKYIDFNDIMNKQRMYKDTEKESLINYKNKLKK